MNRLIVALLFLSSIPLVAADTPLISSQAVSLETRYQHLDPFSLTEQLAFYHLYSETPQGKAALKQAWFLLHGGAQATDEAPLTLPPLTIQGIISLVTRRSFQEPDQLTDKQLCLIERLGSKLGNRKLRGHTTWTKEAFDRLPTMEIDLGRGLLLNQYEGAPEAENSIRQYEATMDLMALQILARLAPQATALDKIKAINTFIFHEMQFRFPPHSLYPDHVDHYTFLPSVLDGRQGVCLGVSILYLCLAQRLELSLEIITPPGHIYLRYHDDHHLVNIETTARGIDTPSELYLGINTRSLPKRTIREVLGMAHYNHASLAWSSQDYKSAIPLYEKAAVYQADDPHLKMLYGMSLVMGGRQKEGKRVLKEIVDLIPDEAVSKDTIAEDYLKGYVSIEGLKAVFLPVNESRQSILDKQKKLKKIVKKYPNFRGGLFQLAITYLQLSRLTEAKTLLEKYHDFDPTDATVEYYLSLIAFEQLNFNQAWKHLKLAQEITHSRNYAPKPLKQLKAQLIRTCPPPLT